MSIVLALALFLVPGYLTTLFFRFISGFFKRIAYALVLGVSFEVILGFLLAAFYSPLIHYFLPLVALGTLILGFWGRKRMFVARDEWKALHKREKIFFCVLVVLALAAAVFVFYPHFGYLWPIHADEWGDVAAVQSLLRGRPLNTNPYVVIHSIDYKPGFTSLWAGVMSGGLDPIGAWVYLPAFNMFLISLVGSLVLYEKTKNFWAGGLVSPFLASLHSSTSFLGLWFFVPSIFALFFVLFLIVEARGLFLKSRPELFVACTVSVALALVYLPFLGFVLLSLVPIAGTFSKKFPVLFFTVVCIGLAAIVLLLLASPYKAFWSSGTLPDLSAFFVSSTATVGSIGFFSFFDIVPVVVFIAAVFGFCFLRKEKWARVLAASVVVGVLNVTLFYVADVSFLAFPQRSYYFAAAVVAVVASVGLGEMLARMHTAGFLKWGVALVVLGLSFWGYFILIAGTAPYHLVGSQDLKALDWLKKQPNIQYQFILSEPSMGTIITPLTGAAAPINWITPQGKDNRQDPLLSSFFDVTDCSTKQEILSELKTGFVYSHIPQACPFLEEVYNADGVFIYRSMV
ncbi:hypothetical protein M1413_04150 [Patescibacteria group bacterium]|nr:hypothetical protein [Patescibacteria group bacterium]MCL5114895.1 hypothetical protein [Patescibacteria group bacterium]